MYVKRNNCTMKTIFIMCLLLLGEWSRQEALYLLFVIVTFFANLFIWWDITLYQFSTGPFHWRVFMILHAFVNLSMLLILIRVWCLNYWVWPTNVTLVNISDIIFNPCFMCDRVADIYKCSACANVLHACVWSKWVAYVCICSFWLAKNYLCWFIHDMIIPNAWIRKADFLHRFGNSFLR